MANAKVEKFGTISKKENGDWLIKDFVFMLQKEELAPNNFLRAIAAELLEAAKSGDANHFEMRLVTTKSVD